MQIDEFHLSKGSSAKKAYLNCLEEQQAWVNAYSKETPSILSTKRYLILSTETFDSKQEAISWYFSQDLSVLKYRTNTAGALILQDNTYLFITLPKKG